MIRKSIDNYGVVGLSLTKAKQELENSKSANTLLHKYFFVMHISAQERAKGSVNV